ncbi:MAG: YfcE family phosphodiesterase [Nanoarchaeota archaeon]|nr:YfcE family phosphodiesterase [Nanoarchaeota archaeon]
MIGLISDTHDNVFGIRKAVEIFKKNEVVCVIHCGDIIAPVTVKLFAGLKVLFVKGNCDGDVPMIKKKVDEISGSFYEKFGELDYKGKSIAFTHGNDAALLKQLISSKRYDYVIRGHTHESGDEMDGSTRVINPGTLYLGSEKYTIALLDVENDEVRFIELNQ